MTHKFFKFFPRNSTRHFVMTTDQHLGNMNFLRIWHDSSGTGNSASWYLSKIVVEDLHSDKRCVIPRMKRFALTQCLRYFFLCNKWMAVDEDDGLIHRILPVAGKEEITGFSHLFFSKVKKRLSEDHLWVSVGSRPSKSHFTRLQRLGCCALVLFSTMIANAMWYGAADSGENDFVLQLGPITISAAVLLVSIFGSLTVFPINLIVVQLFRKSRPKHIGPEDCTEDQQKKAMSHKQKILAFLKQKYWFPHWVTYIAWALTILTNLAACFFIILYALDWGEERANKWLSSLLLSTIQSVFFVQPIKVNILVFVCSVLQQRLFQ